ncbi:MAG TPA: hypothetical protein VFW94_10815 [Candidatus Acidoferrales bacterium]|nr:hypothetical protein [Candidatus Acidoferrales bacterium]
MSCEIRQLYRAMLYLMGLYLNTKPTRTAQFNIVETIVWSNSSFSRKSSRGCAGQQ